MNKILVAQIEALLEEKDQLAAICNVSAAIKDAFKDTNWAGFYIVKNDELVLGPFQGKAACTHIPFEKGVCGACYTQKKTLIVKDVHEFPGHIACDSASNSEIVTPIFKGDQVVALIDIDSPLLNRFNEEDKETLEAIAILLSKVF